MRGVVGDRLGYWNLQWIGHDAEMFVQYDKGLFLFEWLYYELQICITGLQ